MARSNKFGADVVKAIKYVAKSKYNGQLHMGLNDTVYEKILGRECVGINTLSNTVTKREMDGSWTVIAKLVPVYGSRKINLTYLCKSVKIKFL